MQLLSPRSDGAINPQRELTLRLVILSFYYTPDLSAGTFRTKALVTALLEQLSDNDHIEIITTLPNRYRSFINEAPAIEAHPRLTIRRVALPSGRGKTLDRVSAFAAYARAVLPHVARRNSDLVYATSAKLFTATLAAWVAQRERLPLYLDIRDIFAANVAAVLPKAVAYMTQPFLSVLERFTISRSHKVNLVSPGFQSYFESRYPERRYSCYTNGIDPEFIAAQELFAASSPTRGPSRENGQIRVLYAGNFGEGQGLEKIIPPLAARLNGRVVFRLIGDGDRRSHLEQRLKAQNCTNVQLVTPMQRDRLITEYQQADILFLHLNDYSAFKVVLPSKIFEYAATGKPILAGVSGFSALFISSEIENAAVFKPCDAEGAVSMFEKLSLKPVSRVKFIESYSRSKIMREMAADVLSLVR